MILCGTLVNEMQPVSTDIKYCLYARKSSESDERQAMSIDSQVKEMTDLAKREGLNIVKVLRESHSAKESSKRPVFNELLMGFDNGEYNACATWAPDRMSRNAGDLGSLLLKSKIASLSQGNQRLFQAHFSICIRSRNTVTTPITELG